MTPIEIVLIVIAAVVGIAALVALIFVIKGGSKTEKTSKAAKPVYQQAPQMPVMPEQQSANPQNAARPFSPELPGMIAAHAKDFEGLYESIYVSCSKKDAFDNDAYFEWCDRAEMSTDRSFAAAFAESFAKSDEINLCRSASVRLLACIEKAGITRVGEAGTKVTFTEQEKDMYTCVNSANAIGKTCTVVKPVWVCAGKPIEQGVLMADNT